MKETFLQTGSFEEVQATVKQIRSRSVKDQDTEKPVTKLMLKETWKWDEWGPQFHDVMHEAILMYVFVKCVIFYPFTKDMLTTKSDDWECLEMGSGKQ